MNKEHRMRMHGNDEFRHRQMLAATRSCSKAEEIWGFMQSKLPLVYWKAEVTAQPPPMHSVQYLLKDVSELRLPFCLVVVCTAWS